MTNQKPLLSVKGITVFYDAIKAINSVSFDVYEGEIVTLIGGNGAGKSTVLRTISGMLPYSGSITYDDKNLKNIPSNKIVKMGIAHVPEGRCIFGNLTVLENLKLATWHRKDKKEISNDYEKIFSIFNCHFLALLLQKAGKLYKLCRPFPGYRRTWAYISRCNPAIWNGAIESR